MKYIKTYNQLNEGLMNKMVGISDEYILKSLEDLSDSDKIKKIITKNLPHKFLPDDLIVDGNFNCFFSDITELPDNLTINGELNCSYNKLNKLPNNLTVKNDLQCFGNNITELPDDLIVGGILYLGDNPISYDIEKPNGVKKISFET